MVYRRKSKVFAPKPLPPTTDERIAALKEARDALSDAWLAGNAVKDAVDEAIKQEEQVRAMAEQIRKIDGERVRLEERLRSMLFDPVPRDIKRLRQHAETMRRVAVEWRRIAMQHGAQAPGPMTWLHRMEGNLTRGR